MPTTPVCTIDATGIHQPDFVTVLNYLVQGFQSIYGADIYLGNDSQDGQLVGIYATALDDTNSESVATYNAYRPEFAQGAGLSSIVKINGIAKKVPTFSTCDMLIVGQAGLVITNGAVRDPNGVTWFLPTPITIDPISGQVIATATAGEAGAIALANNIGMTIATPTLGWQSTTSNAAATPGQPVETDAALRKRQRDSTAIPALTVMDGLVGALESLPGVVSVTAYVNNTGSTDVNTVPAHSIAIVIDGGDAQTIVNTIGVQKTPGVATFGTSSGIYTSAAGIPETIFYSRPSRPRVIVTATLHALSGFTNAVQNNVAQALADWVNNVQTGTPLQWIKMLIPGQLYGGAPPVWAQALHNTTTPYGGPTDYTTFELTTLGIAVFGNSPGQVDLPANFNTEWTCALADVALTIT